MFTVRFKVGFVRPLPSRAPQAGASQTASFAAGGVLRGMALLSSLALGLPQMSSAQALGTMQVTARVVSASVAWTGVAEAGEAARGAAGKGSGRPLVRRGRLIQSRAEVRPSGGHGLLLVTVHHLQN